MANAVLTRSMTRKQKTHKMEIEKESSNESDESDIDDCKYVRIDAAVDNLYQRRQLRQRLLNTIFKQKSFNKIFNFDSWPDLQESDEELRLVIMYITMDPRLLDKNSKWYRLWLNLKKDSPILFRETKKGNVKLNDKNILTIKRYNRLDQCNKYVCIVPLKLRDLAIQYAHNNKS